MLLNVNARSLVNKTVDFNWLIQTYAPSLICVTETWLNNTISEAEFLPPGFSVLRKDREDSRGGGVAIFLKNSLKFYPLPDLPESESLWCKISVGGKITVLGVIYRPPGTDHVVFPAISDYILKNRLHKFKLILCGDFNVPHVDWNLLLPTGRDRALSEALVDLVVSFDLTQVVDVPTRENAILDLVFLNEAVQQNGFECEAVNGVSDHKAVLLSLNVACEPKLPTYKTVLDFTHADDNSILAVLAASFDDFLFNSNQCHVDLLVDQFYKIVEHCIHTYVPQKCLKRNPRHPWLNREIIQLTRRIKRLRRHRNTLLNNQHLLNSLKTELREKMHAARKFYYESSLTTFMKNDPSKFWKTLNPAGPTSSLLIVNEQPSSDSLTISEAFNGYFKSVFSTDDGTSPAFGLDSTLPAFPELQISYAGVVNLLLNIDTNKSAGADNIPNTFLKRYAEWNARYLTVIFQRSLETGIVPQIWKNAKVVPVFKSGDKQVIPNYRPISLICTCCKILEHIIHKHVVTYLTENNLLSQNQHGFRAGFSTVTQLLGFTHDIASTLNDRGQVDAIFIDYSKAFDTVCHNKLLLKLKAFLRGTHGIRLLSWLSDYLNLRQQFVAFNNSHSSSLPVTSGVPQGSVLGPLLFLIYLNDVVEITKNTKVKLRLYADDCVLYSCISTSRDQIQLNNVFSSFRTWSSTWQMALNLNKTVSMTFTNKKEPLRFSYGQNMKHVNEYKYLGVTFSPNLKWHKHINLICSKALRKLGFLKRTLKDATHECKLTAYKSLIRPVLEYASVVWSPHCACDIAHLEGVQKKAIRFIYHRYDHNFSPSSHAVRLSLKSLEHRRTCERIGTLHKIVNKIITIDMPFSFANSVANTRRSNPINITPFMPFLDCFKFSFFPFTVELWNNLDVSLRKLPTNSFLNELPNHVFC